ncbi:DNA internalization-related competence protein ComEC/Rec2 [Pseudalkalibacillus berkeleyi]|uniref:DNA internalization-related competence protein ComEC/Rec2 n=1 Tax=Pseudalkalibacillus berkeleyi TaxID=1069813 RepID=A0ABS9H2D6_9BACL|nr:DNA internalization-related competence protein ComEC/Rec2 [Pseudalkalibacillus berkeleyi]MCF6137990.1 DNA internalization-related competence protein ComEC/Rec2 [Pseudalkalibacillus berkeleyi]
MIVIAAIIGIFTSSDRWWLFFILVVILAVRKQKIVHSSTLLLLIVYLASIGYTLLYSHLHVSTLELENTTELTGQITSIPEINGDLVSFRFNTSTDDNILVHHSISTKSEKVALQTNLSYGDICQLNGTFEQPMETRNFYSFDYKAYLKHTYHIEWIFKSNKLLTCRDHVNVLNQLHHFRQGQMIRIKDAFSSQLAPIMNTLIFGDKSDLNDDLIDQYQRLGLIHLLVVSGLHVGTILGMLYLLLIRLGMTKERGLIVILLMVPVMIIVTGGAPSVIRAGAMAALICILTLLKLKVPVIDQLSYIALGLLVYKPFYVFHIGFQLSFVITVAIVLSNAYLLKNKSSIQQLILGSFVAQVASLPIVLWNFHTFSLWSLPLNIIYIPAMTILILPFVLMTYGAFLIFPSLPLWKWMSYILEKCFAFIHVCMESIEKVPIGKLIIGRPTVVFIIILIIVSLLFLLSLEKKRYMKWGIISLFVVICFMNIYPQLDKKAYVSFLDVGQGDAVVIELPYRKAVYVIDTGGRLSFDKESWQKRKSDFNTGKDIVAAYLKARGIHQIDALFLTHGDQDHIGGTLGLIDEIAVESVVYVQSTARKQGEVQLINEIGSRSIPITYIEQDMKWQFKHVYLHLISPMNVDQESNNRSLVLYMNVYDQGFLFTGDVEEERELSLIQHYPTLNIDILKVAHHGSKTSTSEDFLDHVTPSAAIISVGKNNRYHHPSEDVVKRLNEKGIRTYITAESGAVLVVVSSDMYMIKTVRE